MRSPWDDLSIPKNNITAQRINNTEHSLDLFWGKDIHNHCLFIFEHTVGNAESNKIPELEEIQISHYRDETGTYKLVFTLVDNHKWEIFYSIIMDIIRETKTIKSHSDGMSVITKRLKTWQNFLKSKQELLWSEEKIKGLIGELYFLSKFLIPRFGAEDALSFWTGPEGSPQDFVINNTAVEIKSKSGGSAPHITISSENQLSTQLEKLFLFVVTLSSADSNHKDKINLQSMINQIFELITPSSSKTISRFQDMLLNLGYISNSKYSEFNYLISAENIFSISDGFPRICPEDVAKGISKVTYSISMSACRPFEVTSTELEESFE